jgi:hypothetical protein
LTRSGETWNNGVPGELGNLNAGSIVDGSIFDGCIAMQMWRGFLCARIKVVVGGRLVVVIYFGWHARFAVDW